MRRRADRARARTIATATAPRTGRAANQERKDTMSARRRSIAIALGAAAALLLALSIQPVPAARAHQGAGSRLTIYVTACPPGYAGGDYYADCAHAPLAGVAFVAHGGDGPAMSATSDADGVAVFDG